MFFSIRFPLIDSRNSDFKIYASSYIDSLDKETTVHDKDILYNKIKPDYYLRTVVNITKWTELQITKNKDDYLEYKEAYLQEEEKKAKEYKEAEKTFEERINK